jgi:hypothetical protein
MVTRLWSFQNFGEVWFPGSSPNLTGHVRKRPDGKVYQVRWHDNTTSWVPEYDLQRNYDWSKLAIHAPENFFVSTSAIAFLAAWGIQQVQDDSPNCLIVERETRLELATPTLARLCSTN